MATTPTQLTGLFKEAYGDDVIQLVPDVAKLIKMVDFVPSDKEEGNKYHQPVIVSNEHGVTYAAASAGAFTLNAAISMNMQDAQVEGSQLLLRSALSYDAAAKASNSKKAFMKATELLVENMMESITKRLEISSWYGGSGVGVVDSSVNTDTTHTVLQLLTASWASGIWAGMEGAQLNFYKQSDGTLVSSGADAIFTITVVNTADRKLTVSGTTTGIGDLDTAAAAGDLDIYFRGSNSNEMSGINKIITNTGTLFNISATTYNLWRANSYDAGTANLSMSKVLDAIATGVDRGLSESAVLMCNPRTWSKLNSDLAALRRFDGSYTKTKGSNGVTSITYHAQNGDVDIISHNIIKEGEAFIFPVPRLRRLGAQDVSFKTPGRGEDIFTQLADAAGYEMRVYTDQAIFIETPARTVKVVSIVNS
jgi:hypothetical protein